MSQSRFPVRAVLFDLDGTLLDTIDDLADAANRMLADLNRSARPREQIHSFVGKGVANLVRRCMTEDTHATESEIDQALTLFLAHYATLNGERSTVYPGIVETLEAMRVRGLQLACVTNKAAAFTQPLLRRMGLDGYFASVVCGDTLATRKPDPEMLVHACAVLGATPAQALMIGDSANDALAARGAGMPVLLLTYGYSEGMAVDTIDCDGLLSNAVLALDRISVI
ncbi:MAG: phosphoglycolate phosphatase [Rhodocyclales bacterium]|nr:phosphoglycolate phosphatase [Rhodocyclales bacterium]